MMMGAMPSGTAKELNIESEEMMDLHFRAQRLRMRVLTGKQDERKICSALLWRLIFRMLSCGQELYKMINWAMTNLFLPSQSLTADPHSFSQEECGRLFDLLNR
ncbi:hypothetical protein AX14_000372 [Amanita brunnescens Koide BX004]|nr:hypothetical protein AX14_000372 [Amanita brunnescens Koide BX004]